MATTCINHPTRQAAAKCRQCMAGLCINCRQTMPDGGVYCSDKCWQEFRQFQQIAAASPGGARSKGKISILGSIRTLIIAAVLVAVIFGVLVFWLKTTDPGEMLVQLKRTLKMLVP